LEIKDDGIQSNFEFFQSNFTNCLLSDSIFFESLQDTRKVIKVKSIVFEILISVTIFHKISANGLALGEEADFEALNCQPSTKVDAR
jgi:hypothetical protein